MSTTEDSTIPFSLSSDSFSTDGTSTSSPPSSTSFSTDGGSSSFSHLPTVVSTDLISTEEPGFGGGEGLNGGEIAAIAIAAAVGILLFAFLVFWCLMRSRKKDSDEEHQLQPRAGDVGISNQRRSKFEERGIVNQAGPDANLEEVLERLMSLEVPRHNIKELDVLGRGYFGHVYKAEVRNLGQKVGISIAAVKSLNGNASDSDKTNFVRELEIMTTLPPHQNVVQLLGCVTIDNPLIGILEYMENGNLKDFMKKNRSTGSGLLSPKMLLSYGHQVACGMTHISRRELIHRDLAARNVLVNSHYICKISDFGFARDLENENTSTSRLKGPLPIRWMAPESIKESIYSTKTDVWSFGILLWEIITLGATPYPDLTAHEVRNLVMRHETYKMDRPEHCSEELYQIMERCWNHNPVKRPVFPELAVILESMLESHTILEMAIFREEVFENRNVDAEKEKV